MSELIVRKAMLGPQTDEEFIFDSWLRCYRKSPDSHLPDEVFFPLYRGIIKHLMVHSKVEVLCIPENEDAILGYIVYDPSVVHWIYIKRDFRGQGLGKLLIDRAGPNPVLTFTTPTGRKRLRWPIVPKALRNKLNKDSYGRAGT